MVNQIYPLSMSTAELQELVASNARTIAELRRSQAETDRQMKESRAERDRQMKERDRQMKERDRQMKESRVERYRQMKEAGAERYRQMKEAGAERDRQMKESKRSVDKQLKELGKQIGGLGNKFGAFTEGMVSKSVEKILRKQFGMESVGYSKINRKGKHEEYDILAYSNGGVNKGIVVEVKSKLTNEVIEQMERKMSELFQWLPEHKGKTFEGMIAYVHAERGYENEIREKILSNGWHLVSIGEDVLSVEDPKGFEARQYCYSHSGDKKDLKKAKFDMDK